MHAATESDLQRRAERDLESEQNKISLPHMYVPEHRQPCTYRVASSLKYRVDTIAVLCQFLITLKGDTWS